MMERRNLLTHIGLLGAASLAAPLVYRMAQAGTGSAAGFTGMRKDIEALERARGGRLGVAVLDTASGRAMDWRGDERFAMCSTFKFLLAGHVLALVDAGKERLDRTLPVPPKEKLLDWSPATTPHAGGRLDIVALCHGIITQSDNTGANMLLDATGGPEALTAWLRQLGDTTTRCDRPEPAANLVPAGEVRDTTTPVSMLGLMRTLLLGNALSAPSRTQLTDWLIANTTGDTRLRAGLPAGWKVGDKTGSWDDATNDIAIVWPTGATAPLLITSYYRQPDLDSKGRNAVLAELGRIVARGV
ncbi:class A beta-lactamase [Niveispirillum sp. BGYR6]|uniref:class A beta-lactamase n=1 Tax=Niveispirillum sp. BGYR6 TaxID=2971249 RepID=UPI0022B97249|nr:class A beta-lactamase [Niveispirillum sp. BGYR6]MDG5495916.1 class A beta-lactamase [Niveispirillum sp. BGYR6]